LEEHKPCGAWSSPIDSADLVRGALRLSAPSISGGRLYWLEGRPSEGGRQTVMSIALGTGARSPEEATPPGANVRTRVHEYGGGEYTVSAGRVFYVDDRDGRVHVARPGGASRPISPAGSRFADLQVSPAGDWLVAVEERPREGREPENRLVAIGLRGAEGAGGCESVGPPRVIAAGHDFYASAVFAPGGDRLAWLAWDHPHMPWNATVLEQLAWGPEGPAGPARRLGGGSHESLFQPRFARDGRLFVVSDRSGWWNLVSIAEEAAPTLSANEPRAVHSDCWEIGRPQWVFGLSTWDFIDSPDSTGSPGREVLASVTDRGSDRLMRIDLGTGRSRSIPTTFRAIGGLVVEQGWVACVAGSADHASGVYLWRLEDGTPEIVRESSTMRIPDDVISRGEPRELASAAGRTTHAIVYAPRSGRQAPRRGDLPPLLVKSHGGPTSATTAALDPRIQYWTSRGFAVADVNYGGSSGYGRAYRDLLETGWGVVDVEDCAAVARRLAAEGLVDGNRLAISGGSAGGFTTLCALTFESAFAAGASHYGIGDLEALARDTHKFESRYTDWLVGPLPECLDRYHERSPIHHTEQLACPVIFFQGLEDRVVPPSQAEAMVAALARRGLAHAYVPFEGEQHGFRRAENIRTALDGELYFYSRVFGFDAPQPSGVDVIPARSA
jgi:dipeptidyl aminopeptidase/acylaminoacyl peptidase